MSFKLNNTTMKYELEILKGEIKHERIYLGKEKRLDREKDKGKIFSAINKNMVDFHPPIDKLTVQVRRDKKDYPYIEELYLWGSNYAGYSFSETLSSLYILIHNIDKKLLSKTMAVTPYVLDDYLSKEKVDIIIADMKMIGYKLDDIAVEKHKYADAKSIILKESDLLCKTVQNNMSSGMYRAFSAVVILNYLSTFDNSITIAIDDIGEGLDYDRTLRLIKLIYDKFKNTNLQLILTSNNRYALNAVDVRHWNILERKGHHVRAYNYKNSKKEFDEFRTIGLSNVELYTEKMYRINEG